MFQHNFFENLYIPDYLSFDKGMREARIPDKEIKMVKDLLRNAQNFYLGSSSQFETLSVQSIKKGGLFGKENIQDMDLPYPVTVFWFEDTNSNTKSGILALRGYDYFFVWYLINNRKYHGKKWIIWPTADFIAFPSSNLPLPPYSPYNLVQEKHSERELNSSDVEVKTRVSLLSKLQTALLVLSCRNISYETIDPPRKLNKKRRKKKKEELVSYKVLNLKPFSNQTLRRSGESTGDTRKVHLCRGHFKTYTEENALFGKFAGRFWWQPQVRGDKKKGLIEKDYNVEV